MCKKDKKVNCLIYLQENQQHTEATRYDLRMCNTNRVIDLLLVDVIYNPLTDFLCAVFCATFNLNFGSADVLSK